MFQAGSPNFFSLLMSYLLKILPPPFFFLANQVLRGTTENLSPPPALSASEHFSPTSPFSELRIYNLIDTFEPLILQSLSLSLPPSVNHFILVLGTCEHIFLIS